MDEIQKLWEPIALYTGMFEDFLITANKFKSAAGVVAWHVRIQPNSRSLLHGYWFTENEFFDIGKQFISLEGANSLETGPRISPSSAEESAIRKALATWEQQVTDKAS